MRKINRKSPLDFILPFLILLSVGVIAILGYQVWQNWDKQGKADAYFYVAEGTAKLLPYGKAEWDNAYSGTKLLLGYSLKTSKIGKSVIQFYNSTVARLGDDTSVTLTDLSKTFDNEKIVLNLNNGYLWMHGKKSSDVKEAGYEVRTPHMKVKATGTVFEVENGATEVVRVFEGAVSVDVIVTNNDKERVADTINVGVGQEMVLDEATIKAFEQSQSPSVLKAVSDQFKSSEWYLFNIGEDNSPTNYADKASQEAAVPGTNKALGTSLIISTQQGGLQEGTALSGTQVLQNGSASTSELANQPPESNFGAPVILKPDAGSTVEKGQKTTISGTVGKDTVKVVVEQVINGVKDVYTLGKYKKGSTDWSYNVSEALGNLKAGDNTFSFYAVDAKGTKSENAEITINYNKPAATITDALAAPTADTFNGSSSTVVTVDTVKIQGSVKGAEKVFVNDYALSKFEPGSTTWVYTAKESFGNLLPGKNEFAVYAVATDGTKSAVTKFTITYNKTASTTAPATTTTTTTTPATTTTKPATTTVPSGF